MGMQTETSTPTPSTIGRASSQMLGWVLALLVLVVAGLVLALVRLAAVQEQVDRIQTRLVHQSGTVVIDDSVAADACRLLGALADAQGIPITDVFDSTTLGACETAASEGAAAAR